MQQIDNKMLTATQAAIVLNVHVNTIRRWTDAGALKSYRIGARGDRRIRMGDIERFINTIQLQ